MTSRPFPSFHRHRLGLCFVHPRVTFPPGVEEALGCPVLAPDLWSKLLTEAASIWNSSSTSIATYSKETSNQDKETYQKDAETYNKDESRPTAKVGNYGFNGTWLIHVLSQLYKSRRHSIIIPQVKNLKIFPTAAGSLVSLDDGPVLQLNQDTAAQQHEHAFIANTSFAARTLRADFAAALARDGDASKMAVLLGVVRVDADSFLRQYVLPALCDVHTDELSLITMLVFLKNRMTLMSSGSAPSLLRQMRGKVYLVDNQGRRALSGPVLHIGREYVASAPDPALFLPPAVLRGDVDGSAWPTVR